MAETPTPGQICYAAWEMTLQQRGISQAQTTQMWQLMSTKEQAAWEAAAQAVLAQCRPPKEDTDV